MIRAIVLVAGLLVLTGCDVPVRHELICDGEVVLVSESHIALETGGIWVTYDKEYRRRVYYPRDTILCFADSVYASDE